MSDPETRAKRAEKIKRKRNPMAKELFKGPFKPKVIDPRKEEYKRVRIDPRNIEEDTDE